MSVAYTLERLGVVMEPAVGDEQEAEGVLNPGGARGRDGAMYLFPRLVAARNYSRIGRARVHYDGDRPVGVERLGIALEPEEPWERNRRTGGGVEDARVTFVRELDAYVMTYTAYGPRGAQVALAVSSDLETWRRLGPVSFVGDAALNRHWNKNAVVFPEPVRSPAGAPAVAVLHRPMWRWGDRPQGIWVSFVDTGAVERDVRQLTTLSQHHCVAVPEQPWEALKIGAGTPPVRTDDGWLILYHGVSGTIVPHADRQPHVRYSAGAMVLDHGDVRRVVARTPDPLLEPETPEERSGFVPNVVFPTAIDVRGGEADVYYGMADSYIGAARLRRAG